MKEEKDKNGVITSYFIGDGIIVHTHIKDPEHWHLTIRTLNTYARSLCKITCTKNEIARYVYAVLNQKKIFIESMMKEVLPFT